MYTYSYVRITSSLLPVVDNKWEPVANQKTRRGALRRGERSGRTDFGLRSALLEALLFDDGLGVLDGLLGVGVLEAAARLAVLELGPDARADPHRVALRVLRAPRAAPLLAVRVRDAAARRELCACRERARWSAFVAFCSDFVRDFHVPCPLPTSRAPESLGINCAKPVAATAPTVSIAQVLSDHWRPAAPADTYRR